MSTQTDKSPVAAGAPTVWSYLPGVLWAALMLGVLTWWLQTQNYDFARPIWIGTGVLFVISLALFVWGAVRWYRARADAGRLSQADAELKPLLGVAMLIGGVALLALAGYLLWQARQEKVDAFGEVSSMVVMGLICVGAGLSLRATPVSPLSRHRLFQWMLANRKNVAAGLMVVGGLLGAAGLYFLIKNWSQFRQAYPGGPEGLGMLLIGLVLLGGGLWTNLTMERQATADTMRLLTLYLGSATGLVISLFTALRVILWWNRYFSGGLRSWQGEDSWRFWACAYIELIGLVLLLGSLVLGRVDIRVNATMRRALYGYNAVLQGLLLLVILVVLNLIIIVRFPANVEWTHSQGMYSLSGKAEEVLSQVRDRVRVYVLMSRYSNPYVEPLDVRDLMDNVQGVNNKISVEYVSPDLDSARYRELAKTYPELASQAKSGRRGLEGYGRGLLIVYGEGPDDKKLPHVFVPDRDLADTNMQTGAKQFKGEQALIQNIQQLVENKEKPKFYFTQMSGELWITDLGRDSCSYVVSKLRKDNYDVAGLIWDSKVPRLLQGEQMVAAQKSPEDKPEVPADCKVLVIVNVEKAYPKEVLAAIDRYTERGGKVLVLTRLGILNNGKINDDGMDEFCKKLNVELGRDLIIKKATAPEDILRVKATVPPAARDKNKLAAAFQKTNFTLTLARSVRPAKATALLQSEVLLQVTDAANGTDVWAETAVQPLLLGPGPVSYVRSLVVTDKLKDKVGTNEPIPAAVLVTDTSGKPKAVVIGDFSIIADDALELAGGSEITNNYEFFRSNLEWLSDRKVSFIGIPPVEKGQYSLSKDEVSMGRLVGLPLGLVMLALAGTGAGIWIVRRK